MFYDLISTCKYLKKIYADNFVLLSGLAFDCSFSHKQHGFLLQVQGRI